MKRMFFMIFALLALLFPSFIYAAEPIKEQPYKVKIKGAEKHVLDGDLLSTMEGSANLFLLIDHPPSSSVSLIRRAASDKERMLDVLKSFGYYAGKVTIFIEDVPLNTLHPSVIRQVDTPKVVIEVMPGSRYKFNEINLLGLQSLDLSLATMLVNLKQGTEAKGSYIIEAEGLVLAKLALDGYPYAKTEDRKLVVNHLKKSMDVTLRFTPGPRAQLGKLVIKGLEHVEDDFVRKRITWQPGDLYHPKILKSFRTELNNLGVFSSLKLNIPDTPNVDGAASAYDLPVELLVEERQRKFIGFGLDYSSTEQFGVGAYWGHRNLFGRGEKLKISSRVDKILKNDFKDVDTSLELEFSKPDFLTRSQELLINGKLANEHSDAYDKQSISSAIGIKRKLSNILSFSGGISGEYSSTKNNEGKDEVFLIGFPLVLKHDTTNDLLNPQTGFRNAVSVTPYFIAKGGEGNFTVGRLDSRAYYNALESGNVILAGRFAVGSIYGETLTDIPPDKKFYSGGGGSVRGYEYQHVGPLDVEGSPTGGLSFVEVGFEIRWRYQDFGIVPFVDGGNVFASKLPKLEETLQWAAGIGLRYYSAIGPLRIDLAFPIDKREDDDSVAFYLSIGQAF